MTDLLDVVIKVATPIAGLIGLSFFLDQRKSRKAARSELRSLAEEYWEKVDHAYPREMTLAFGEIDPFEYLGEVSQIFSTAEFHLTAVERITTAAKPLSSRERDYVAAICIDLVGEPLYNVHLHGIKSAKARHAAIAGPDNKGCMSRLITTGQGWVSAPSPARESETHAVLGRLHKISPHQARKAFRNAT